MKVWLGSGGWVGFTQERAYETVFAVIMFTYSKFRAGK